VTFLEFLACGGLYVDFIVPDCWKSAQKLPKTVAFSENIRPRRAVCFQLIFQHWINIPSKVKIFIPPLLNTDRHHWLK